MHSICYICGTQFADSSLAPFCCPICTDERQYVGLEGQQWMSLADLRREYKTRLQPEQQGLTSFSIEPKFGIGQRSFLVETASGNLLWDCLSLLDEDAVRYIRERGGLQAIAISHPHYYTCMVEWSRVFGDIPIYLHAADKKWVMRPDDRISFWSGESLNLFGGLQLVRCAGHFEGAAVMHWPDGANGRGALLTGDTIQVVPDRKSVSFMYSYPNYIPLNKAAIHRIVAAVQPLAFEQVYGAFPGLTIQNNGKSAVIRSAQRYLAAIA
jgi:hypothetical protein